MTNVTLREAAQRVVDSVVPGKTSEHMFVSAMADLRNILATDVTETMEEAGMRAAKAERWIFTSDASLRGVIRAILRAALAATADAPKGQKGTTLQYDAKNRLSYVWLIWALHERTNRWELQGICTSEVELTPRVRAIKNDPNTIQVRTEVAFVDHLFAAGETVGDYANRLDAQQKEGE